MTQAVWERVYGVCAESSHVIVTVSLPLHVTVSHVLTLVTHGKYGVKSSLVYWQIHILCPSYNFSFNITKWEDMHNPDKEMNYALREILCTISTEMRCGRVRWPVYDAAGVWMHDEAGYVINYAIMERIQRECTQTICQGGGTSSGNGETAAPVCPLVENIY